MITGKMRKGAGSFDVPQVGRAKEYKLKPHLCMGWRGGEYPAAGLGIVGSYDMFQG